MSNKKHKSPQKEIKTYLDLLYMTPEALHAKDIALLFQEESTLSIQLWEEMNVVELELPNQNSIDFEPIEASFSDPSDTAFIKNRNIKTIFAINISEADLELATTYFNQLIEKFSGFVCADTDDFTPVIAGSSKRA